MPFKSEFSYIHPNDRLSYLQSNESELDYSTLINPCKSLTDVFNSVCEDVDEPQHLKVYLRIRPLLSEEIITSQDGNIEIVNAKNILVTAPSGSHAFKNNTQGITKLSHRFRFTRVYSQEATQKDIYEDTTLELVKEMMNGQNCLLFTYGATNSGKTHTIQGTNSNPGLLPRTLDTLFKLVGDHQYKENDLKPQHFCGVVRMSTKDIEKEEEMRERLFKTALHVAGSSFCKSTCSTDSKLTNNTDVFSVGEVSLADVSDLTSDSTSRTESLYDGIVEDSRAVYAVFLSFAEIYNEYIYDLLDISLQSKKVKKNPLALGEDRNGSIYVKGLKEIRVRTTEEALQILEIGKHNLHFAATKLNHHSSRSHCIFTLKLVRLSDVSHSHLARVSMLSLCDLAGSERAAKTLNSMDRLKEASNINTSLLVLGRCLTALRQNQMISRQAQTGGKKSIPVPYRDSKVTRLFQTFFMGKGNVALIVNISLSNVLFDETLKVLKFSALASKVTITQEKTQILNSTTHHGKHNSQFANFLRHSLNMSTASSRLSVPWSNNSLGEVTFGGGDACESKKIMEAVPEEEDDENDERYEALMQLIEKLKEKLLKVNEEKLELETKLRKELCDVFSKKIVEIEESWRSRIEERDARAEELMEWRLNHVMGSVKKAGTRKRLRTESEENDDDEMVPSILLVRTEIRVKELEEESSQLKEEVEALKASLKSSMQVNKAIQGEKTKLFFELANKSRLLGKHEGEKNDYESNRVQASYSASSESSESSAVVKHHQVEAFEKSMHEKDKELKEVKNMLFEAAQEYMTKEGEILSLKSLIAASNDREAKQGVLIHELNNRVSELKDELAKQGDYLEEREQEIHEFREQLCNKNASVISAETSIEEQHFSKEAECLRRENTILAGELSTVKSELEDLKTLLKETEEKVASTENKKQEDDMEDLKTELINLHKKYMKIEAENEELISEVSNLKNKEINAQISVQDQQAKVESLENELVNITSNYNMSEKKVKELCSELEAVDSQAKLTKESNCSLGKKLEEVNSENESLQIRISELESRIQKMISVSESEESQKHIENEKLREQLDEKERKMELICNELNERDNDSKVFERKIENLEETIFLKEQQEKQMWQDLENLRQTLDKNSSENEELVEMCQKLRKELAEKEEEIDHLANECTNLKEYESELNKIINNLGNELKNMENISQQKLIEFKKQITDINYNTENILKENANLKSHLEELRDKNKNFEEDVERKSEIFKLLNNEISELKVKNSELMEKICLSEKTEETQISEIKRLKIELNDAEAMKVRLIEKKIKLEENLARSDSRNQQLQRGLSDKDETISKINAKTEALDRKGAETEQEIECYKTKCQLLEKEVAALREARIEEVNQLKSDVDSKDALLTEKDEEINTLQQEMKRTLQMSSLSSAKEEHENSEIFGLRDRLRENEIEKSSLLLQISSLQQELSDAREVSKFSQFSFDATNNQEKSHCKDESDTTCKKSQSKGQSKRKETSTTSKSLVAVTSETSEVESSINDSPAKLRQTRSGRVVKPNKELESYTSLTPQASKNITDTSEGEDLNCAQPQISSKGRRGRPPAGTTRSRVNSVSESPDGQFRVPRSTRRKNLNIRFDVEDRDMKDKLNLDSEEEEEENDDEEFIPQETKKRSSKKSSRRAKSSTKLYNPHLDNKENTTCGKKTENDTIEDSKDSNAENEKPNPRPRRGRRPLHTIALEEAYECSPTLIEENTEDSPHTLVRRKLRSKAK